MVAVFAMVESFAAARISLPLSQLTLPQWPTSVTTVGRPLRPAQLDRTHSFPRLLLLSRGLHTHGETLNHYAATISRKTSFRMSQALIKAGIALGFVTAVVIGLLPFAAMYFVLFGWPL